MASNTDMEESSEIINIIKNMALAHEMVITDKFELNHLSEEGDDSLVKRVSEIMHTAFWDLLQGDINKQPPDYSHAVVLFVEVKQLLLELVPVKGQSLRQEVEETLDEELIKQQIENQAFDLLSYANFVLDTLSKLCAPVRDENIAQLRNTTDVVPLLRGVLELINLMKLDLANYQLKKLKPILIQQSVDYEREKFEEYIQKNPDGLNITKSWLKSAYDTVKSLTTTDTNIDIVITHAYLSLIDLKPERFYPETLLMDEKRLQTISDRLDALSFEAAIIALWLSFVGERIATNKDILKKIKSDVTDIIGNSKRDVKLMENIYEHLITQYDHSREEKESSDNRYTFKEQLLSLVSTEDNTFRKVIVSRIRDVVLLGLMNKAPPGPSGVLAPIHNDLQTTARQFIRIIQHNKNVHSVRYKLIVQNIDA